MLGRGCVRHASVYDASTSVKLMFQCILAPTSLLKVGQFQYGMYPTLRQNYLINGTLSSRSLPAPLIALLLAFATVGDQRKLGEAKHHSLHYLRGCVSRCKVNRRRKRGRVN